MEKILTYEKKGFRKPRSVGMEVMQHSYLTVHIEGMDLHAKWITMCFVSLLERANENFFMGHNNSLFIPLVAYSNLGDMEASTWKFWFGFGDWSMVAQLRDCTQRAKGDTCKVWFSWFGSVGWLIEVFEHSYRSADKGGWRHMQSE